MPNRKITLCRGVNLLLSVLILLLISACNAGLVEPISLQKAPQDQQVLRWPFPLPDILSFDPGVASDVTSLDAIQLVFTGLVDLDETLRVQPQLARSYTISDDGLTYTFSLPPSTTFSDGTALTSRDVVYSIDRALSPEVNNQSGVALTYLGLIAGAQERTTGKLPTLIGSSLLAPDPTTVVLKLAKAAPYFLEALTYPTSYVVEKKVIDQWGAHWTDHLGDHGGQGGAGPFKVLEYNHTKGIRLVTNEHYYAPHPQLHEIDYLPYKDANTSFNAYLANQVDLSGVPLSQYSLVSGRPDFHKNNALTISYVGMNYRVRPLDNIHIRQALSAALNRDVVVKVAWHGAFTPTCHIVPHGMPGYNPTAACANGLGVSGDKVRARQLLQQGLQEEGLSLQTFPQLTLTYPSQNPEAANEATTEVQLWKSVLGITINTTTMSQNSLYTAQQQNVGNSGPLQMWLAGWGADYPDPQDFITLQFGANAPNNAYNFGNNDSSSAPFQQELQKQMAAADVMSNQTVRMQTYHHIEQQILDQVGWLTLYQRPNMLLLKLYVQGVTFLPTGLLPPNSWARVYIAEH